jgi:hypothetical protein
VDVVGVFEISTWKIHKYIEVMIKNQVAQLMERRRKDQRKAGKNIK